MNPGLPFQRYPPLLEYLRAIRNVVFSPITPETARIVLVLGNPSADLDSFISAITYSYFQNHVNNQRARGAIFVPLLNMPKTRKANQDDDKACLKEVITIRDVLDSDDTRSDLRHVFRPDLSESSLGPKIPLVLVDHNAPAISIPKIPSSSILANLDLIGCIDHHVDEHVIPEGSSPRIVTTGIGSCTTLVVSHLRQSGTWPKVLDSPQSAAVAEVCHLALAPILVDTKNLKAGGEKCSDLDRAIVAVLQNEMSGTAMMGIKSSWNRDDFYEPVFAAKAASLDLLTAQEMFERDYKSWTEGAIEIGISSLVRPVSWLVEHFKGGAAELAGEIQRFAKQMQDEQTSDGVGFEVFVMLTPGPKGGKGKEVVMVTFSDRAAKVIEVFEEKAGELKLEDWDDRCREDFKAAFDKQCGQMRYKVWWMTNREKTRKQGAPLVREAVSAVQQ
ncbi:Exopolyphosphatase [Cyphellophora attinorum]|uniref:Exopolyphosphatase n=1 Tax=Cyphellophora attinorum TaxID=1664694 RepID=A0A0N1HCU4_9EURO|nr:Exopolyphosphatase [Phialophora attinorum]KPI41817.1 Exopolyphosphatase [Phialophora attinorum]